MRYNGHRELRPVSTDEAPPASHARSDLSDVAITPAGDRLYFASQRANGSGAIYEVRGPFRRRR
jgi:hypothetical protein